MEKEFIPYELAVKLKELGFNEHCFAFYQREYAESIPTMVDDNEQYRLTGFRTCKNSQIPEHYVSAPTFSQAFRWFRKKEFLIDVTSLNSNEYEFYIQWSFAYSFLSDIYKTYEAAELACLDKLIEIVELKQQE